MSPQTSLVSPVHLLGRRRDLDALVRGQLAVGLRQRLEQVAALVLARVLVAVREHLGQAAQALLRGHLLQDRGLEAALVVRALAGLVALVLIGARHVAVVRVRGGLRGRGDHVCVQQGRREARVQRAVQVQVRQLALQRLARRVHGVGGGWCWRGLFRY